MKTINFEDIKARAELSHISEYQTFYRMRLDFRFEEHICIRDVVINASTTLNDFHTMIQACGNWMNYHLYNFEFIHDGRKTIAELPSDDDWDTEPTTDFLGNTLPKIPKVDPRTITLEDAIDEFPCMLYSYDYGDGWEICVSLLSVLYEEPKRTAPYCVFGKGDWPPEDVGGEGGFEHFLLAIKDPQSEDHDFLIEWGEDQGYEKYTLARCNANLAHWEDYRSLD